MAARVLTDLGVSADDVVERIREDVGFGDPGVKPQDLTPRSKLILNYASEEAVRLRHNYIGTEHILLGIIREDVYKRQVQGFCRMQKAFAKNTGGCRFR